MARLDRLALALALTFGASRAQAVATAGATVLSGPVDAVVVAGDGVAALRAGAVVLLDGEGRAVAGCGDTPAEEPRPREDHTALSREEVLREAGFSDEDVSPEAEEILEDEGVERRRAPAARRASLPRVLALAGGAESVWLGTAEGLWRLGLRDGACAPVGLGGEEIGLVAARGAEVVAIAGFTVWRSRDDGATFDVAAVLTSTAHALALAADGETIDVADADGLVEIDGARTVRRRLEVRVDALTSCGDSVVAMAADGLRFWDAGGVERLAGPPPPARALACGAAGLAAAGVGVWTSADGTSWREDPAAAGRTFSAIIEAGARRWLVPERGGLELVEGDDAPVPPAAYALGVEPLPRAPRRTSPPLWAHLLPRVAVAFDGWAASTGVAGWRLWLLLTVSLDRRWQRSTIHAEEPR